MRSSGRMLFVISLLVLAIASTSVPAASATAKVGKLVLNPTHALPGTLVSFEGVGWDLPAPVGRFGHVCIVYGEPVKIDHHAICNIEFRHGPYEPAGTFIVNDIPADTYSVYVVIDPGPVEGGGQTAYTGWLTGEVGFTVDAATTIMTTTTAATTTPASSVISLASATTTVATSTPIVPATVTVTTTKESATIPQAFDYPVMLALILAVIVVILILILIRRTRSSR